MKTIISLSILLITNMVFAGDLGSSMQCTDSIEDLSLTLEESQINDNGVYYSLVFRAEGKARAIKQNLFGQITGEVFSNKVKDVSATCGVGYIHNNIDGLEFSGGVIGNRSPVGYGLIIRGSDIILVHTRTTGLLWDTSSEAGPGERVVGFIDWDTKVVTFHDIIKVGYSTYASNKVFINPFLQYDGDSCSINVGWYDEGEAPFYPYDCD